MPDWPPATLPVDRTNATTTLGVHPDDHNEANRAINDIVAILGASPQGAEADLTTRLAGLPTYAAGGTWTGAHTFEADVRFKSGRPWVDVSAFGTLDPTGAVDNSAIFQAALDFLTAAGGTLFVPRGTYLVGGLSLTGKNNVRITGDGVVLKRMRASAPDTNRWLTVTSCNDFRLEGLTFDANGIERYGGINFYGCKRVWVDRCYAFDSDLNASWVTYDHYFIVFQATTVLAADAEDLRVTRCVVVDLELVEADNVKRVFIVGNTSYRAAATAAIGWFSVGNGYFAEDYYIADNLIIDPRKSAINITHEASGLSDNVVRGLRVINNRIVLRTAGGRAFNLGNFTGIAEANNLIDDVVVMGNTCWILSGYVPNLESFMFMKQSGQVITRAFVHSNRVLGNPGNAVWAFDLRGLATSSIVAENYVDGAARGMSIDAPANTWVRDNFVSATTACYQLTGASGGGNRITRNRAVGGTAWNAFVLAATDLFSADNDHDTLGLHRTAAGVIAVKDGFEWRDGALSSSRKLSVGWSGGSVQLLFGGGGAGNVLEIGCPGSMGGILLGRAGTEKLGFFGVGPRARPAGWATATGTATRTAFDTATVTTAQLAERVKALIDDLHSTAGLGLIST